MYFNQGRHGNPVALGFFSESLFWFWVKPEAEAGT